MAFLNEAGLSHFKDKIQAEIDQKKDFQSAVPSPATAAESTSEFIDTVSQDANGVITATKKHVYGTDVPMSENNAESVGNSVQAIKDWKPTSSGTAGQVLKSKGDGTTEWGAAASQADVNTAVNAYMSSHMSPNQTIALDDSLTSTSSAAQAAAAGNQVLVADSTPSATTNKIWIKKTPEEEITIPTMDDHNDLKSALVKMTEPTTNLWEWGDFLDFTTQADISNVDIPAGTYMFSAVVTSNATANQVSSFYLYHSDSSITTVEINRNTRSGRKVAVPKDVTAIRLYASNTYNNSNGKVASWRDIGIFPQGTSATYYVPNRMPVDIVARDDIESLEDFDEQIEPRVETLENTSAIDNPLLHRVTEATENLWTFGDQSFTTSKVVGNISLPAGAYTISAIVESSDTVSTSSKMNLNHEDGTYTEVILGRNTRSGRHITVSKPVVSISAFASNTYNNSVGKTASWSDVAIYEGNVGVNYYIPHDTAIDFIARENSDRNKYTDYWKGKKIVWFGTSIPAGVVNAGDSGGNGSYPVRIGQMLGATVYNESVGSSCVRYGNYRFITDADPHGLAGQWLTNFLYCLSASSTEKQNIFDNWAYWKNIITEGSQSATVLTDDQKTAAKDCSYDIKLARYLTGGSVGPVDLYVFDHGHNDEYSGWGSHTYSGYDEIKTDPPANDPANRSYFIGAMRFIINLILQDNPKAKILFIGHYENDRKTGISEAQEHLHEIWKFPLIRTWEYMGWSQNQVTINGVTKTITQIWMPDDLHPASDTTGAALTHYAEVLYPLIRDIR